jgi:hypothetical protein
VKKHGKDPQGGIFQLIPGIRPALAMVGQLVEPLVKGIY